MNRHDAKSAIFREPDARVDALARTVLDAAFEVHRHLGPGFLESVYEEALTAELELRDVTFARQVVTGVEYKGRIVGNARLDPDRHRSATGPPGTIPIRLRRSLSS